MKIVFTVERILCFSQGSDKVIITFVSNDNYNSAREIAKCYEAVFEIESLSKAGHNTQLCVTGQDLECESVSWTGNNTHGLF